MVDGRFCRATDHKRGNKAAAVTGESDGVRVRNEDDGVSGDAVMK